MESDHKICVYPVCAAVYSYIHILRPKDKGIEGFISFRNKILSIFPKRPEWLWESIQFLNVSVPEDNPLEINSERREPDNYPFSTGVMNAWSYTSTAYS
jgi:hypothetical protein